MGAKTYINVNKHVIAKNAKHGTYEPPIRVTTGKRGKPRYGHVVKVHGPVEFVYNPYQPVLPCGARLAVVTEAEVTVEVLEPIFETRLVS